MTTQGNKFDRNEIEKFILALEHAPVAVFIMDSTWNFEYINPEFERLSGYSRNELLHRNIRDTLYKNVSGIPESRQDIISSLIQGKSWKGELLTIAKDGSKYWAETTASPYKNDIGEIEGFIVIQNDVTERKVMGNALRESEKKYKTLVENSLDGIMIVRNNKILFMNDTFCNMLGYGCEVVYNSPSTNFIHPDDQHRAIAISERRKNGDKTNIFDNYRLVRANDEIIECEVYSSVIEYEGEIASFFTIHNVTENRRMQREIEEKEALYRTLIEKSQDGVVLTRNRKFFLVNQSFCDIFGYARDEIMAIDPVMLLAPEHRERVLQMHDKRMSGEADSTESYIATFLHKSEKRLTIEINSSTVQIEGENLSFVTLRDITEQHALKEALEQSERKYRNLIEKATDGIVITQDGKMKFANLAMCEMLMYAPEEMIERSFFDFVPLQEHEEMRQYHIRRMRGETFNALYRSRIIRKDGKIITVELNARTLDYEGQPAAFIVVRDITERLQIEIELKQAKNELEMLNHNLEARVKESSDNLTEARTQLIRLQKENLQSQFEVLRQQVNPHFLFNSLNVLTSLIKLEPDLAEKFTEHLSKVYRYVLENKDNDLIELKTELDFIDAYLFLLNIRFLDKIAVTINIENEKSDLLILPLALQLLIENAIKHNSMSKKIPLSINIFVDENNFLNVVNNLQERESFIASTGVGLKNINHRYQLLEMPAPVFIKTENEFIAKIPLKENNKS